MDWIEPAAPCSSSIRHGSRSEAGAAATVLLLSAEKSTCLLEAPPVVVQGWGQVLQSFHLPADPAPEPNLLDEGDRELGPL